MTKAALSFLAVLAMIVLAFDDRGTYDVAPDALVRLEPNAASSSSMIALMKKQHGTVSTSATAAPIMTSVSAGQGVLMSYCVNLPEPR